MRAMLAKASALDADFPGLGKTLRVDGGSRFYRLPEGWLADIEYDVSALVRVTRGYDVCPPVEEGGARDA